MATEYVNDYNQTSENKSNMPDATNNYLYAYTDLNNLIIQPLDIFGPSFFEPFHEIPALIFHASVSIGESIFITGGVDAAEKAKSQNIEIKLNFDKLPARVGGEKEYGCQAIIRKEMASPRFFHGIASLDRQVMVVGGLTEKDKATAECEMYDIGTDSWRPLKPLPAAMGFVAVVSYNNKMVFTFGGAGPGTPTYSNIYQYNILSDEWSEVSLNENQGWKGSAGSLGIQITTNQILLFGGETKSEPMKDSYFFDPDKKSLRKAARTKADVKSEAKTGVCVKAYERRVFAVQNGKCSIYDINSNAWNVVGFSKEPKVDGTNAVQGSPKKA